jgi:glucose/arabinose dehydrogenase
MTCSRITKCLMIVITIILTVLYAGTMDLYAAPVPTDSKLSIEQVYEEDFIPSSMSIVGPNDVLILDRDEGKVFRIIDGKISGGSLIDLEVGTVGYRGLLGIAIATDKIPNSVFLYFTRTPSEDGQDESNPQFKLIRNEVYRYQLVDNKLVDGKLLLSLPALPGPRHMGGKIAIGPDNDLYVSVGDLDGSFTHSKFETMTQNYRNGSFPDGRAGILRITQDGKPDGKGILGSTYPLNLYYAYGIRNSFGFDWDPITNNLWDTENGPYFGDEINLVYPGFNSGWAEVQGLWKPNLDNMGGLFRDLNSLESFSGKGTYSEPEFTWIPPVAPTSVKFLNTNKLGSEYENDILVADANEGNIYHFELDDDRKNLKLGGKLFDKIANNLDELDDLIFASGFGRITDMELGPDGMIYVLSTQNDMSSIHRISLR